MSAPESNTHVESALADALAQRRAAYPGSRPSLVDVHRRARRRSSRRAAVRAGAVVGAGAAVVAGGWAVAQRSPQQPTAALPAGTSAAATPGPQVTTLSVADLWSAVADRLGATVDDLRAVNPDVDFDAAPVPDTPLFVPGAAAPTATLVPPSTVVATFDLPTGTSVVPPSTVVTTSVAGVAGHGVDCVLTDAQIQSLVDYVRSIPAPGSSAPTAVQLPDVPQECLNLPPLPEGWTLYQVVAGDYLAGIAARHCTTLDELVAGNEWAAGANTPLFPTDLIAVPAGDC